MTYPLPLNSACGIRWSSGDIDRFLSYTLFDPSTACLLWQGGRSRGRGNTAWYGSFWTKGKTVRAHKFYGVAVLGLRPEPNGVDHLDHYCPNSLCVRHIQTLPQLENLRLRWIRTQVGLTDDRAYLQMDDQRLEEVYGHCPSSHPEWLWASDPLRTFPDVPF